MKGHLARLGGQLGVGLCVLGLILVFLGWNGAASRDRVPAQFPYLISGGIAGLCLVVVGVGMIVVQNQRADRAALQSSIERLREAIERGSGPTLNGHRSETTAGAVVAGRSSYHRPDCHLVRGRDDGEVLSEPEAVARGLDPCRICQPGVTVAETSPASSVRRQPLRAT